jgi:hypothetical protein
MLIAYSSNHNGYQFMESNELDHGKQSSTYECFKGNYMFAMKIYSHQADTQNIKN